MANASWPNDQHDTVRQSNNSLLLVSFCFLFYFLAFHPASVMKIKRERKQMSDNEVEKAIITSTAVHKNYKIRDL